MTFVSRKLLLTLVGVVGISASSQNAHAGFVYGAANTIGFENRENVTDADSNFSLTVGDSLQGILKVESITAGGPQSVTPEITGVFDVTVKHVLAIGTGLEINPVTSLYNGLAIVLFGATNTTGAQGLLAGLPAGAAVAFYQDPANNLLPTLNDPTKSTTDAINAAKDGTLQGAFGFGANNYAVGAYGAAGNGYWYSVVNYVNGFSDPTANFYYGLQALAGPLATTGAGPVPLQNSALDATQVGLVLPGSGTLIANNKIGGSTGFSLVGKGFQEPNDAAGLSEGTSLADRSKFSIYSQDPAALFPSTPEPGSIALALIGGGLFVPMARRRRERKNASAAV